MIKKLLLAATALLVSGAAQARTVVLPTVTTRDFIISGSPRAGTGGNPVTLVSFDVNSPTNATIWLHNFRNLGAVQANQTTHFAPGVRIGGDEFGYFFARLNADSTFGVHELATWSNVTLELGDQVVPLPEPATWAMMIGGFALAGTAARRRTRVAFA